MSFSENIYVPGMVLLDIIIGASMTVTPNGKKEGSTFTKLPLTVELIPVVADAMSTLTYRAMPNVLFPLVTIIAWKLLP